VTNNFLSAGYSVQADFLPSEAAASVTGHCNRQYIDLMDYCSDETNDHYFNMEMAICYTMSVTMEQ